MKTLLDQGGDKMGTYDLKRLEIAINNAKWETAEKAAKMSKSPKAAIL